jgi:hypothetical protein
MVKPHTLNKSTDRQRRKITKNNKVYKSYLLRLCREENSNRLLLRLQAVEQDTHILSFAGLESFIAYLESISAGFTERFSTRVTLFVRQSVQDYEHWKRVFSEVSMLRRRAGGTEEVERTAF